MKALSTWLLIIGGLNWLLVGALKYDVVAQLLGGGSSEGTVARIVYVLVGLAAIMALVDQVSGKKS